MLQHSSPRSRPCLFSDGQNIYKPVVLVCTVDVYILASLGRRSILRYQVLQVRTHIIYSLRTDSYVSCMEYKQFEINTSRHLLSAIFIARYFKYRKQKHNLTCSLRLDFYLWYLGGYINIFCKLPDQS